MSSLFFRVWSAPSFSKTTAVSPGAGATVSSETKAEEEYA